MLRKLALLKSMGCSTIRSMSSYGRIMPKGFIDGQLVDADNGNTYEVFNPSSGEVIGNAPNMGSAETHKAIASAKAAFDRFKNITANDRAIMLEKMRDIFMKKVDDLAKIVTLENGKPFPEAKGEIMFSAAFMDWYAGEARRIYGDVISPGIQNRRLIVIKQPVGVVGCITPWNHPSAMLARKAGAALAAGCTTVARPAEDTPFSAILFAKVAEEAGVPKGVINVVTSSRENAAVVGKTLCESPLVAKISFTGSTEVGKLLMRQAAGTMKRFSGELGGNAPFIVFNSAKLDQAVAGAIASKFRANGQTCICANRFFVQDKIYDAFVKSLADAVSKKLVVGDGFKSGVTQGPLINERAANKVERLVNDAMAKGAVAVVGGGRHPALGGNFFEPTVLTNVNSGMQIFNEEIFGPVASLIRFESEAEAINMANQTRAGLGSYIYSQDYSQVWRVSEQLEYGMVGINEGLISTAEIPFGGIKESGVGREGSKYGVDDYVQTKLMCFGNINSEPCD